MNHETRVQRMMFPQSNQSLQAFGMYTDAEKYLWIAWLMVILIVSLAGNLTVLIGSIRYNAIRLNKVTTTLIIHTAISDLGLIFTTIPTTISLITDSLVYGKLFCEILRWVNGLFVRSSCLLVVALNCSKLANLVWPVHSTLWSRKRGHKIGGIIWIFSSFLVGITIMITSLQGVPTIFAPSTLTCLSLIADSNMATWLTFSIEVFLTTFVPIAIVFVTTTWLFVLLCKVARRSRQRGSNMLLSLNMQGVLTVIGIAVLFVITYAPKYGLWLYMMFHTSPNTTLVKVRAHRSVIYLIYLNCSCNFFIYVGSIKSFQRFIEIRVIPVVTFYLK